MRLVSEAIMIIHDDRRMELRPSLRAAYLLEQKHGLTKLWFGALQGNLTIINDIVSAATPYPHEARNLIADMIEADGVLSLLELQQSLSDFICMSFGLNDGTEDEPSNTNINPGKSQSITAYLVSLYEYATGWLGWTPETAWTSTPAEIMTALKGWEAKHRAIHGGKDDLDQPDPHKQYNPADHEISPEQLRENLARLKALSGRFA